MKAKDLFYHDLAEDMEHPEEVSFRNRYRTGALTNGLIASGVGLGINTFLNRKVPGNALKNGAKRMGKNIARAPKRFASLYDIDHTGTLMSPEHARQMTLRSAKLIGNSIADVAPIGTAAYLMLPKNIDKKKENQKQRLLARLNASD